MRIAITERHIVITNRADDFPQGNYWEAHSDMEDGSRQIHAPLTICRRSIPSLLDALHAVSKLACAPPHSPTRAQLAFRSPCSALPLLLHHISWPASVPGRWCCPPVEGRARCHGLAPRTSGGRARRRAALGGGGGQEGRLLTGWGERAVGSGWLGVGSVGWLVGCRIHSTPGV
jgi:hypothetical protein